MSFDLEEYRQTVKALGDNELLDAYRNAPLLDQEGSEDWNRAQVLADEIEQRGLDI